MDNAATLGLVTLKRNADMSIFSQNAKGYAMHADTIDAGITRLIESTVSTGGASASMTGRPVPDSGYMVGGYVDSLIFDRDLLTHGDVAYQFILKFVMDHFRVATKESMFLGAWIDTTDDRVYIDISQHFVPAAYSDAMDVARFNEEIAIWDLGKNEEIRL